MTVASVEQRKRFSLELLTESRPARAGFGVVLVVAMLASVLFILGAFTGRFTNVVNVQGRLPGAGNALPVGSLVLYNNVTVGEIGKEGIGPHGTIAVTLRLYPNKVAKVPDNVQAIVSPLSIFGNQAVDLVLPVGAPAARSTLVAGDVVPAATSTPSTSLQDTTTQIYNLLSAVQPAKLDKALTAFATALQGEGAKLGSTLRQTSDYLGMLNPLLPTTQSDIALLAPASNSLAQAAPNIIATLGHGVTTGQAVTSNVGALNGLLHGSSASLTQLTTLFAGLQTTLPNLLNASGPVLADISRNPNLLPQTLAGLGQFAAAVASEESHGPFLSVNVTLPIVDINAAVQAALGYIPPTPGLSTQASQSAQLAAALGPVFDPIPYSSADCPRYPGEQTYCTTANSPAAPRGSTVSAAAAPSGSAPTVLSTSAVGVTAAQVAQATANPFTAEVAAVQSIASALGGGGAPASPGLASVLLLPLFSSMATGG